MPRASWKGYLKLSAVSCPVALFPAETTAEKISFTTVNRATGHRVRQIMVDEETGREVPRDAQVKGLEVDRNAYAAVSAEELDALKVENTRTICVERFVPEAEVHQIHVDGSHWLAPDGDPAAQAFAVIREAMAQRGLAAVGRVVLSTRERLVLLRPRGRGMLVSTLRWAHEVRPPDAAFGDIPDVEIDEEMLDLATHVVGRKRGRFDFAACEDEYEQALIALVQAKQEGREPDLQPRRPGAQVIDLKDALRRSVEAEGGAAKPQRRAPAASKSRKSAGEAGPRKRARG